ncbi:MAG: hypothetical protein JRJ85_10480, partial [Deltaproteobacteria bacterium]|nr:hypothetical protein [Deltaproteobacteria bacterium]
MMKTVLLIASDFPPKSTSSSRRPFGLAKYLPEYGWNAIVLTPSVQGRHCTDHPGIEIIESDLQSKPLFARYILDRIHKRSYEEKLPGRIQGSSHISGIEKPWVTVSRNIIFYPDRYFIPWYRNAFKKYLEVASTYPFDAIISTAMPLTAHIIARRIKRKTRMPWIADFRDLWPVWHFYHSDREYYHPKRFIDRVLIRWVLKPSTVLV